MCRGPYGGQDPNLLGNPLLTGNLANSLADSLGLTQGLAAVPPSQSLPTGLPNGLPGNGALGFNMGLPNGGGRHHIDSLSAVCLRPSLGCCLPVGQRRLWWCDAVIRLLLECA